MDISRVNSNNQIKVDDWGRNIAEKMEKLPVNEGKKAAQEKNAGKDLDSAVDLANKALFKNNTHLKFEIHEGTNEILVKIVDDVTGEVLREIPPEKILDMVAKLWEIAGILIDERR